MAHNSNLLDIPINPKHRTSYPPHKTRNKLICFPHLPDNPHKHETQPELLKAFGLQIIRENSSLFDITIYTDGSQLETGLSGSGIAIYKDKILEKISLSHPRHLSVYKSELSAIDTALKDININSPSKIIIYSDSRAAIYTLQSCFSSQEPLLKSIAKSVNRLPANSSVTVQWLPAHVGIPGNELADSLAKAGALRLPEARESTTQLDERDLLRTIKTQCLQEWKSDAAHDCSSIVHYLGCVKQLLWVYVNFLQGCGHENMWVIFKLVFQLHVVQAMVIMQFDFALTNARARFGYFYVHTSILQAKEEEETDQVDEEVDPIVHIPHPKEVLESIQTLRLFLQCQDESKSLHRYLSDLDNIEKSVQHFGDFDTRDKERGRRPIKFEDAELEALLDEDSSQTQEELAETLGVTQQAISNSLKVMGMVQKQGNWVPYELKPGNIERHICTCELLLKRQNWKAFMHRIVTRDERWIHYDNPKRRKSWVKPGHASTSTAKPNIHGKKLMLCIWWDQLGVIYYELLQPNETITGERYQQQLMRLSRALKIKRPLYAKRHDKVIYQHDNARPHVAKVVKETLEALQWDVLPHPLYSPDIAPSDYHMFRSMTHGLAEQHFTSYEEAKNWVNVWIASKDEEFFRHGIRMLPERWEKVVAKDGQYFE
ncbi:hypothetical protein LAZ67_5002472 [Cordylochernes scorpioides]|uniref:RNase H type-1 domain-containing protein n=1 Tax=Cordylochernes scorpioides TaxID=51811 RepID=A0ABY6KJY2_9ARAC|nr:hypothetical protein LAZ67_5002472 [Cordylochernes scorpioides]